MSIREDLADPKSQFYAYEVTVIFRKAKDNGEIFALFPYEEHSDGRCTSYAHVGQHTCADYNHCIATSVPAKPKEYRALRLELTNAGYSLIIRKRKQFKPMR
jgi:hypothetical protein